MQRKQNIYKCKAVEMQMTIEVVLRHDRITGLKKAAETARNISRGAVNPQFVHNTTILDKVCIMCT